MKPTKFYGPDLAYIHDSGFLDFARAAAPGIVKRLKRSVPHGRLVVEIGCGSGELARCLVKEGWRVLGIDRSPDMLRLARNKAPAARFRLADWRSFTPPLCDAMVAAGECFNYFRPPREAHELALAAFIRRAGSSLKPRGLLVFDFLETRPGRRTSRKFLAAGLDWVVSGIVAESGGLITRRMTTVRFMARGHRVLREVHKQLRIGRPPVEAALRKAGFEARFFEGYGRTPLPDGHVVVAAVKRANARAGARYHGGEHEDS
jgi:SAM-dependent methyltransferase